ncbi:MAG TPA: hypothetical protein VKF81_02140 [Blastocatellia bacterium]|nr:hypothetical protein [Blastocatellia bacterium]
MTELLTNTPLSPKNLLISMVLALSVIGTVDAQHMGSDREFEALIGPVKTVREETARFSNKSSQWTEGRRSLLRIVTFDEKGMMTQAYVPGLAAYHVYGYGPGGDRLERQTRELKTTTPPTFSDFGFQSDVWVGASFYRYSFNYDARGNRVEEARYKRNDRRIGTSIDLVDRMIYTYDQSGRRTESALYDNSGVLIRRWRYVFEGSMYPDEAEELRRDGSVIDKTYYTYEIDPTGNWVKRTSSKWISTDGKQLLAPIEVTYRTIVYY